MNVGKGKTMVPDMWRGVAEHEGKLIGCAVTIAAGLLVLAFFVGRWTSHF